MSKINAQILINDFDYVLFCLAPSCKTAWRGYVVDGIFIDLTRRTQIHILVTKKEIHCIIYF